MINLNFPSDSNTTNSCELSLQDEELQDGYELWEASIESGATT